MVPGSDESADAWMRRTPLVAIAIATMLLGPSSVAQAQPRMGGMVDSILWADETDQDRALQELVDGGMDIYMFPLRSPSTIAAAKANPNLWTLDGTGGLFDLFLNPVPVNQALAPGVGNPFSKREVREAMNYLIDRDFIANEIAGGGQLPQVTLEHRFTPEYARDPVFMSELEARYRFNPPLAAQIISDALSADPDYHFDLGTQRWQFKGTDISLNFVIRAEDLRRDIGNYIADQLERVGFGVNRMYTDAAHAFSAIWVPPPDNGRRRGPSHLDDVLRLDGTLRRMREAARRAVREPCGARGLVRASHRTLPTGERPRLDHGRVEHVRNKQARNGHGVRFGRRPLGPARDPHRSVLDSGRPADRGPARAVHLSVESLARVRLVARRRAVICVHGSRGVAAPSHRAVHADPSDVLR
ncbi:MAG: hypothetical protein E6K14_09395 [Methanobacteriota archaeon]|nr:MAG: hypothetical protein E6K14_09395 [Euryarchaeota archaeon]